VTRPQVWLVHASNLLVGGTGLVYAWMLYLSEPVDEFALVNHPWQPEVQALHVVTAPLLVFAAGWIWSGHVLRHWRLGTPRGRRTGIALALLLAPMVASGYLLQTAREESWREAWIAVHLATSALWVLAALVHPFLPAPRRAGGAA
jgi:hypothetical protein